MNTDSDDIEVPTRAVPGDSLEPQDPANENQDGEAPDLPRNRSALARLSQSLPTLVVLGALASLGFLGHHYGWKIPKFSELTGRAQVRGVAWCEEHGVPEAECVACNAQLMPKGTLYGWCREHGVHECVLHNPQVAQLKETPKIAREDLSRAARAIAVRPRTKNDSSCKKHLRRIQFPTSAAADKAGIDIGLVDRGSIVESVATTGEIVFDPTRVARVSSRADGIVWRVYKSVGDEVESNDVLALVDSAEAGRAKAELLAAAAQLRLHEENLTRLARLEGVVAGKRLLEVEAARAKAQAGVRKSVQTLQNLGLAIDLETVHRKSDTELSDLLQNLGLPASLSLNEETSRTSANLIPVLAPREGAVVARNVVAGEVIESATTLFTVADTRRMWLMLDVPLEEAQRVTSGQKVVFLPDGDTHPHTGELTWISRGVDEETRTVKVRAELSNEDGHLRNETFGAGEIILRKESDAIVVPSSAVHWEGCCHVAFVRDRNYLSGSYKVFHTRSVHPGVTSGDNTEVIAGLLPGEVVVTKGSGVLRAELLKGNLGAG